MSDLIEYERFEIPGVVAVDAGRGGLPRLNITAPAARAEIYVHGAHVTSFIPSGGQDLLFLSRSSHFERGKPIRGGVPLIFPWFGPHPTDAKLPAHGFARTRAWDLQSVRCAAERVEVEFGLRPSEETRKLWPHEFELAFRVSVGAKLEMTLLVRNTGDLPLEFEEAMHTYLAVDDVRRVRIEGLAGRDYLDKMQGGKRVKQGPEPIVIDGETDRVYLSTPDLVQVSEAGGRRISVEKTGSLATVVWNPWVAKAKAMADFGDDEWPSMLCIESANAADHRIRLNPGDEHRLRAVLAV